MQMQNENKCDDTNLLQTTEAGNMLTSVSHIVYSSIQQLLFSAFSQIRNKQLITFTPQYTHNGLMEILSSFIDQSTPQYGTLRPSRLVQENPCDIVKIQRDNLTPKELPSQHPQKDETVNNLDNLSSGGSKKLGLTNRSSFLKRKASQISQLPSGGGSERNKMTNNRSFKIGNVQSEKQQKSASVKKDALANFKSLIVGQEQDPQIVHLREKANFKLRQRQRQRSLESQRKKQEEQRVEQFNSQFGTQKHFTFDFEGETIGSETNQNDKINYYAMKVGVKTLNNKYRTIYKHLQTSSHEQNKQQHSINKNTLNNNNNKRSAIDTNNSITLHASAEIPIFPHEQNIFGQELDPAKMKILEFKRLYGKKFSRYDKNSITLDLSSVVDKKITEEDFFTSKKHLTDSVSIHKSRSSSVNKQTPSRKLALPKLQGKYKVLDRYGQI